MELIITVPRNVRAGRDLDDDLILVSHFTDGEKQGPERGNDLPKDTQQTYGDAGSSTLTSY